MAKIEILEHGKDRFLYIDRYLWMWNVQYERELQQDLAEQAHGDVLVAGYGFGIVQEFLAKNKNVTSITTVEKYSEVIDYCKKHDSPLHGEIVLKDFYDYAPKGRKFNCIIGDIWPDIAPKFLGNYIAFKEKALTLLKDNGLLLAWGKEFYEYMLDKKAQPLQPIMPLAP